MSVTVGRENFFTKLSLMMIYYYAKLFGMIYFKITNKGKLKATIPSQLISILYRLLCLVVYMYFLPQMYRKTLELHHVHIKIMSFIQSTSIVGFTSVFILLQAMKHKQFINVANMALDVFARIYAITKNSNVLGFKVFLICFSRVACNSIQFMIGFPALLNKWKKGDFQFIVEFLVGYSLWYGTLVIVDLLVLGYTTASGFYKIMGNHMNSFAKRIEASENECLTKFKRMQVLCDFADELDECAVIYSKIFKTINEFHSMFQLNILFTFYIDLIIIIGNMHYIFLNYVIIGEVNWIHMVVGVLKGLDFICIVLVVDVMIRHSKAPKYLNWDCLCSDSDDRWDKTVDHFLNQLQFEDLKIDVYGFLQMNNALCLQAFSVVIAYLTILIQFSLLGYFKE